MKKISLSLALLATVLFAQAQLKTGSNPTVIGNGQLLELEQKGQRAGLKLAEVALTGGTDLATVNIPGTAAGTMVWNTGTGGLTPAGLYVWSGSQWFNVTGTSANGADVGYIVAWGSNATPPDFLIPLSGGTFNKSDYPDFIAQHALKPSQFIASEDATTFTVKNINDQRVLRGNTTTGTNGGSNVKTITQSNLPNISLSGTTNSTTATMDNAGAHTHSYTDRGNGAYGLAAAAGGNTVEDDGNNSRTTGSSGAHTHTINPHSHTFTTSSLNGNVTQTGLDMQSAFADVMWCLRVKPTASAASITINTGGATAPFSNTLTSSGGALVSNVNGQVSALSPATGLIQHQLGFDASGTLVKQDVAPPVIEMAQTASLTIPGGYTPVLIPFNVTVNNPGGWFNSSTQRFTPQKAGYWRIETTFRIFTQVTAEALLGYYKNGALITQTGGIGAVMETLSKTIYFNGTTDYLSVGITSSDTRTDTRSAAINNFTAIYVGP